MKKELIKEIEKRLLFVVKVFFPDLDMKIVGGEKWGFSDNVLTYCDSGKSEFSIEKLKEIEVIGILLKEIAYSKFSDEVDINLDFYFSDFLNVLEEVRVEKKLYSNYPGTFDTFKDYNINLINKIKVKDILSLSNKDNFLSNLKRINWGKKPKFKNNLVETVYKEIGSKVKEIDNIDSTKSLVKYIEDNLWCSYKKLIEVEQSSQRHKELINDLTLNNKSSKNNFVKVIEKELSKNNIDITEKKVKDDKEFKTYEELFDAVKSKIHYFTGKLKSILDDNNNIRHGGSFKKGKLNYKKLYKYKCSNKLFSQKTYRLNRLYNIVLLVDESSSMRFRGSIYDTALSTVLLSEVLNKIGINFSIYGFNVNVRQYKKFSDKYNVVKRKLENIMIETYTKNSRKTNSGMALNYVKHSLKNKDGKNIIIMITDGSELCGDYELSVEYKKMVRGTRDYNKKNTNEFELEKEILMLRDNSVLVGIGIGIGGVYVKDVFPQYILINDTNELSKNLFKILKKNIERK